jgi:ankyrin repeat protein
LFACENCDTTIQVLDRLIKEGANPNDANEDGQNAFHFWARGAASRGRTNAEAVANCLSKHQVEVNAKDRSGDTALHVCSREFRQFPWIAEILLKRGASPSIKNKKGKSFI